MPSLNLDFSKKIFLFFEILYVILQPKKEEGKITKNPLS